MSRNSRQIRSSRWRKPSTWERGRDGRIAPAAGPPAGQGRPRRSHGFPGLRRAGAHASLAELRPQLVQPEGGAGAFRDRFVVDGRAPRSAATFGGALSGFVGLGQPFDPLSRRPLMAVSPGRPAPLPLQLFMRHRRGNRAKKRVIRFPGINCRVGHTRTGTRS
jgi:hypothetical protein